MGNMRFKVGDRVRIKSLDWYNESERNGNVYLTGWFDFIKPMADFCGKIVTIKEVQSPYNYRIFEDGGIHYYTDEMIEGLVERNGKTYPYKIGDRVVLKGNNRCATITDLKYNSWGNLSYYIKIDNDKDICIDYPTELLLPLDNMIEELVGEEIKSEPKFKVGDKITNGKVTLTILTLSSDRYVVEDNFGECGTIYFNYQDGWKIVEEETKPNIIKEAKTYWDSIKDAWICPDGYIFKDENGNIINATKIVLEKKKKEYPKTLEECCKVLGCKADDFFTDFSYNGRDVEISDYEDKIDDLLQNFRKLRYCRDAYWKIAGEEMGLGKPWKPDWDAKDNHFYTIYTFNGKIECSATAHRNAVLIFPTKEMRDAFYENFKELIEQCKELL